MANNYWLIREGKNNINNQLFRDSPWSISIKREVTARFDKEGINDHTYGKNKFASY